MPLVPSVSSRLEDVSTGEREKAGKGGLEEGSKELLWLGGEWFDLGGKEGGIDQHNLL